LIRLVADKNDLLKKYPYKALIPKKDDALHNDQLSNLIPIRAQLITAEDYSIRKVKINVIFRDMI